MDGKRSLEVKRVSFLGAELMAMRDFDGTIWVAIRWVCDGIGLSDGQVKHERLRIQNDAVLSKGSGTFPFPTPGGVQDALCLSLDYVPLWLAKISITPRMMADTPDLAERLLRYQLKVKDVLAAEFLGSASKSDGTMSDMDIAMVLARTPKTRLSTVLQFLQSRGYDMSNLIEPDVTVSVKHKSGQDYGLQRFVDEIIPQLQRDLQPFGQLYALYKAWVEADHITGCPLSKNKFIEQIADMVELGKIPGWYTRGRKAPVRPKHLMDADEPLLTKYHLVKHRDKLKATYTGLLRV